MTISFVDKEFYEAVNGNSSDKHTFICRNPQNYAHGLSAVRYHPSSITLRFDSADVSSYPKVMPGISNVFSSRPNKGFTLPAPFVFAHSLLLGVGFCSATGPSPPGPPQPAPTGAELLRPRGSRSCRGRRPEQLAGAWMVLGPSWWAWHPGEMTNTMSTRMVISWYRTAANAGEMGLGWGSLGRRPGWVGGVGGGALCVLRGGNPGGGGYSVYASR